MDTILDKYPITTDAQMVKRSKLVKNIINNFAKTFQKWSRQDRLYNLNYSIAYMKIQYKLSGYDQEFLNKNNDFKAIINDFLEQMVFSSNAPQFDIPTQEQIVSFLTQLAHMNPVYLDLAKSFCQRCINHGSDPQASKKLLLQILQDSGQKQEFCKLYEQIYGMDSAKVNCALQNNEIEVFYKACQQNYETCKSQLTQNAHNLYFVFNLLQSQQMLEKYQFYSQAGQILARVPQPQKPKAVIVLPGNHTEQVLTSIPLLCHLRKNGYATVMLMEGILPQNLTHNKDIDDLHGIIDGRHLALRDTPCCTQQLKYDWYIDLSQKQIMCNGVNYYHGIYESLSIKYRRCQFDYKNNLVIHDFIREKIVQLDRALNICELMYENIAKKHNLPISILGMEAVTLPTYGYKQFCHHFGRTENMEFYMLCYDYGGYYSDLNEKIANKLAIANLTAPSNRRTPQVALKDEFNRWKRQNKQHLAQYKSQVVPYINYNRVTRSKNSNPKATQILDKIKQFKANNKTIMIAYGKITCDFSVFYDGGFAHESMKDWINHTIKLVKNSDNLLLIKPHPHEYRHESAEYLTEYFIDLIEEKISDNIIILDNKLLNNADLYELIDVGLLWNGTSCLELGANNIPVLLSAYFGYHDYPIEFNYPKSRKDYEDMIKNPQKIKVKDGVSDDCHLLLKYLSSKDMCVDYRYSFRKATNENVGEPFWYMEDIEKFFNQGDENIEILANKFLTQFNKKN